MSVVLGLPRGMLPSPEIAMSSGTVSQLVRVQPNNINTISNTAQTLSGTSLGFTNNMTFPSQLIQFSVPCGQGKHVWCDSEKSSVSFRIRYEVVAGASYDTNACAYLQGGATSWINRLVHIGPNGQTIDDVVNLNVSEHIDHLLNYNSADRDTFGAQWGFLSEPVTIVNNQAANPVANLVQGHSIPALTGTACNTSSTNNFSYEFPLPSSLLGKYAKGFFPCGSVSKLDLQMYTASNVPITFYAGSAAATSCTLKCTIDNISLNLFLVTLDAESARMLGSPKVHYLHGITSRNASAPIAAGSSGYQNTLIGLRGKSCRQLFTRFVDNGTVAAATSATAGSLVSINGVYDSKMPLASQLNYLLQGKDRYPQFPHNTQLLPSSVFNRLLMASEKFKEWEQRSSMIPQQYFKYIAGQSVTAGTEDQNVVTAGTATVPNNLAVFTFGEDLRKVHNSQVLDGYDLTVTANHFLEINLNSAPTNSQTVWFTGKFDIIYEIDMEQGTINYRM